MNEKTKPCPFCGSEWTQVRWIGFAHVSNGAFQAGYRGECTNCGATTRAHMTAEEAIETWNWRANEKLQQYHQMEEKLKSVYGECDGLLEETVNSLVRYEGEKPQKARLLTDEHVDMWEQYKSIGTPEECREAVERQKAKKVIAGAGQEKFNELFELMKENPDLPVIPMVDCDVCADDCYTWWMGNWGHSAVTEYVVANERIFFRDDDEDRILDGFSEYRGKWEDWTDCCPAD